MNISGATLTLFGSTGSAGSGLVGQVGGHRHHHHGGGGADQMKTIADTLGITTDQLKQEMSSGSSLAQIAQSHGKTADDLVNALQDRATSRLDQAVSAGKISQDQATRFLGQLKQRETNFVDGTRPQGSSQAGSGDRDGGGDGDHGGLRFDVASLLGVAGCQGASGPTASIGQALKAYGVDTSGLETTLTDGFKSALDKAVGGGKISRSQEDDLMSQIGASLDQAFGANRAAGADATNPDLAGLLFQNDQTGSTGSTTPSSTDQSWLASMSIDVAA
jgi:polyhydroxyalkanoate synthesis regulator phasin